MSGTIEFPFSEDFPPKKKQSHLDEVIEHIFQVLPAASINEIGARLKKRGLLLTESTVRGALARLRKQATDYQWTIPHVNGTTASDQKYFAILIDKDKTFHTDPAYKANLAGGTVSIVKRLSTESKNQSLMLEAAASATYLSTNVRAELKEMAEECRSIHNKARRVLRYMKSSNGSS